MVLPHRPTEPQPVWTAAFDEDTNAYVSNKGWKEPADLLTSYRNLEKFAGGAKNLLELPPENATPEQLDAFYRNSAGRETPTSMGSSRPRVATRNRPTGSRAPRTSWPHRRAGQGLVHRVERHVRCHAGETAGPEGAGGRNGTQSASRVNGVRPTTRWSAPAGVPCRPLGLDAARLCLRGEVGHGRDARCSPRLGPRWARTPSRGGRSDAGFGVTPPRRGRRSPTSRWTSSSWTTTSRATRTQ